MTSLQELVAYLNKEFPQKEINWNRITVPRFLFRGEQTIDWKMTTTPYTRNIHHQPFFEEADYLLTGKRTATQYRYQGQGLFSFLRESMFGVTDPLKYYNSEIDTSLSAIFQHYGFDTNLLDFTDTPEVAAGFAALGNPGDVGQIMLLETKHFEDEFTHRQLGNRTLLPDFYCDPGAYCLDLGSKYFTDEYNPKWFKFTLTPEDKNKFINNNMTAVIDDPAVPHILNWWASVEQKSADINRDALEFIRRKISMLK